jgi:LmbE family N-acetylglucosaminyl deacetylase
LLALFLAAILVAPAQITPQTDPANLAGERVSPPDLADTLPIDHGAPALQQLLRKLRTRASFMLIVAHPDDEDGGMLTYLSRGQGARVAMLTLNRGEGGQNLMSADFEDALGLIRTQELLSADRYMGVDQLFGTEVDFGFSKTKEEAFAKWTHERVLYDAVRAVRLYRPLVIGSVFIGAASDGHGQHQVSGEIAQEVFNAAGDPKVFPEMGLPPWQPLKVYARIPFARIDAHGMFDYATNQYAPARFTNYVTGKVTNTVPKANIVVPEGTTDPLLGGMSYVQFARQGLALQKTQIGKGVRLAPSGQFDVSYHRYGSCVTPNSGCPIHRDSAMSGSSDASPAALQQTEPAPEFEGTESGFFEGIDTSLPGIATLAPTAPAKLRAVLQLIDMKIADAQKQFDPANPASVAEPLRIALQTLNTVIAGTEASTLNPTEKFNLLHELRIKRVQLNNALVLALGVTLDPMVKPLRADYTVPLTTADPSIYANVRVTNGSSEPLKIVRLNPEGDAEPMQAVRGLPLPPGGSVFAESNERYLKPPQPTRPYFSRPDIEQPFYDVADPALRNAPATPPPLVSSATLDDQGVHIELRAVVPDANVAQLRAAPADRLATMHLDSAAISLQPAVIVPPVSLKLGRSAATFPFTSRSDTQEWLHFQTASSAGIIPIGTAKFQLGASLGVEAFEDSVLGPARIGPAKIPITLHAPSGWQVSAPTYNQSMEPVLEHFSVSPGPLKADQSYFLTATAKLGEHAYAESYRPVGYPGLPYTNYYTPAKYRVSAVDVHTAPNLNIAYLPGTGDDVPAALEQLGIHSHIITPTDLTPEALKPYAAVILGVRAYEAHPELAAANSALNTYAAAGGIVIAQYNTGRLPDNTGPYPLSLGDNEKVVEEDAPVHILAPENPLLTWPNHITPADFDNWIEERGHGFMGSWDPRYQALLETHDAGQQPQRGGLLVARTGKGAWIYLGLALYRQLPEGVPGSYRLLANLISAAKNPTFLSTPAQP